MEKTLKISVEEVEVVSLLELALQDVQVQQNEVEKHRVLEESFDSGLRERRFVLEGLRKGGPLLLRPRVDRCGELTLPRAGRAGGEVEDGGQQQLGGRHGRAQALHWGEGTYCPGSMEPCLHCRRTPWARPSMTLWIRQIPLQVPQNPACTAGFAFFFCGKA